MTYSNFNKLKIKLFNFLFEERIDLNGYNIGLFY